MRIIVIGAPELASALAGYLQLDRISRVADLARDGFVLDGDALDLADVRALDIALRGRAAEVDVVLWLAGGDPAVLSHYKGRVIDIEASALTFETALDRLREAVLAT
jgi:hypothetical protein